MSFFRTFFDSSGSRSISSAPKVSGEMRPKRIFASVTVAREPPNPYAAGPGSEPALKGPTLICLRSSTLAIDPPPAPISIISITGIEIGIPLPLVKR